MSSLEKDADEESLTTSVISRPFVASKSKETAEDGREFELTEFRRLFIVSRPFSTEDMAETSVGMVLKLSRNWLTTGCWEGDEPILVEAVFDVEAWGISE